jgi:hypothetical protein
MLRGQSDVYFAGVVELTGGGDTGSGCGVQVVRKEVVPIVIER